MTDPIAAVTHGAPYGFYARLVAERPFHQDDATGCWVASSARAVTAVLASAACRVRPVDEPVPKALLGSPAAEIFRHLVRMNDGAGHCPFREAVSATLAAPAAARIDREAERGAAHLARGFGAAPQAERLEAFAFALPVHVLGGLLGLAPGELAAVTELVRDFVGCLSPASTPADIEAGKIAAGRLAERFRAQLDRTDAATSTLLAELGGQARRVGCADPDVVVANAIGFLTQAYDATAGLIGTTLLTLAREPGLRESVAAGGTLLASVVDEVARYDAPVQNTRRFVAEPVTIEGRELRPGDAVLVILAAANRDPAANPDPDRFDPARRDRRSFTFGIGPHACPGRTLAVSIARAGVARLLESGLDPGRLDPRPAYRPSVNARIPVLKETIP